VELSEEAIRIHRSAIVIDGHNDLPYKIRAHGESSFDRLDISVEQSELHTDIPRLRRGGVGAQFWAAYVPATLLHPPRTKRGQEEAEHEQMKVGGATRYCLEQIDLIHRMVQRYPQDFEMAYKADDIERIHVTGKIACLIGIENGDAIENSLGALRMFYALGARYLTLTHSDTIDWADSATDEPRHGGLSPFGEKVVLQMNRLGMMVDISHVSADTMRDVLRISRAPIIASHSAAYAIAPHPRNVPDDVLRLVAENGGVVMSNFYSGFIEPQAARKLQNVFGVMRDLRAKYPDDADCEKAQAQWRRDNPIPAGTVQTLVDHIDHIVKVAGVDHVGLGSDYDGVTKLPVQLEDVSHYPYITQELLNRGYCPSDIRRILGGNLLRVMGKVEDVAGNLAK